MEETFHRQGLLDKLHTVCDLGPAGFRSRGPEFAVPRWQVLLGMDEC